MCVYRQLLNYGLSLVLIFSDASSTSGAQDDLDTVMWEYKEDDGEATKIQVSNFDFQSIYIYI